MINYDYKIEREEDEKGGIVEYIPDKIPKELPPIVYIEGPNSSGKSTLLHIISLGFYGLKNDAITRELKDKMDNLLNSKHQNLTFKVVLVNKDNTIKLITEKKNIKSKDYEVYELRGNNKKKYYLSPEVFEHRYKLIYDIPFDPTTRLNSLTNEINLQQISFGNKVGELRFYINEIIKEIINRDPKKLEDIQKKLEEIKNKKVELVELIPKLKEDLELLEKSFYFKYYNQYKSKKDKLKKELDSLEKSINRKTKKIVTSTNDLSVVKSELRKKIFEFDSLRVEILKLLKVILKKSDVLLEIWDKLDLHSTIHEGKFPDRLNYGIEELTSIFIELERKFENDNTFQEIRMYTELVKLLGRYKNLSVKLPGLDQSITEFISSLEELIKKKQSVITKIENVQDAVKLLAKIKEEKSYLEVNLISKLNELLNNIDINTKEVKEEMEEFTSSIELEQKRKEFKDIEKSYENFETLYNAVGKPQYKDICEIGTGDLKDFKTFTEERLKKYISNEKETVNNKNKDVSKYENHIKILEEDIEKLSEITPHQYQASKPELTIILKTIQELESKIKKDYHGFLSEIKDRKKKKRILKDQRNYNNAIFKYLGQVIGHIFHIDTKYELDSIDLIDGIINTKDKKQIRLSDMGTGQSQSAYLKSLLTSSGDKIIIALFDEISSMDSKSLEPIYEKMREFYNDNRLLAGIVVQRADNEVLIKNLVK